MKCIYFTDILEGKRCGKTAFGLLGGNSYCKKHLDIKPKPKEEPQQYTYAELHPRDTLREACDNFRSINGREPSGLEMYAMM